MHISSLALGIKFGDGQTDGSSRATAISGNNKQREVAVIYFPFRFHFILLLSLSSFLYRIFVSSPTSTIFSSTTKQRNYQNEALCCGNV